MSSIQCCMMLEVACNCTRIRPYLVVGRNYTYIYRQTASGYGCEAETDESAYHTEYRTYMYSCTGYSGIRYHGTVLLGPGPRSVCVSPRSRPSPPPVSFIAG